jgi:hypothetical protein
MAMGEDCDELGIALPNPTGFDPVRSKMREASDVYRCTTGLDLP